jgi:alcohol dehydrogenase class IV
MNAFTFNTTPRIVSCPGAAGNMGALVRDVLGSKVMFVTDAGIRAAGLDKGARASLEAAGIDLTVFDAVEADPSLETVLTASDQARSVGCTGVIALGGGSSMDVAKLVALLAASGEDIDAAWGVGNAKGPRLPLVLVPTTAGTGSEVTPVSIITVSGEEKRGVSSPVILPDIAILDAELTLSLPASATAATGIDAMVHAIEAYTSKSANNNAYSALLAERALHLLGDNIEAAVFDPGNVEARSNMLLGSCFAGMAFANSPVAAVHALAYPIGTHFHVPHGLSNALILPEVLRFTAAEASNGSMALYAQLAPMAFPHLSDVDGDQARCAAFIDALASLSQRLGLQSRLRDVGIAKSDLPMLARDAMKQTRLLVNNPREVSQDDALTIYKAAW